MHNCWQAEEAWCEDGRRQGGAGRSVRRKALDKAAHKQRRTFECCGSTHTHTQTHLYSYTGTHTRVY